MPRLQNRVHSTLHRFRASDFSRLRRVALLPLIAATYFMVSGGPYGLEDIVGQAGYLRALLLLCIVPLVWSLPTALMIGELASAMPAEGGFYIWVTRSLGRFWGFQEAWLSLAASVFDMAIYPALAVAYLSQLDTALMPAHRSLLAIAIVVICVAWNLRGAYSVGQGSLWMLVLLLLPFLGILVAGLIHIAAHPIGADKLQPPQHGSMLIALLFVVWNYMGWDNASTIAQEVENPRKNYIRAMMGAVVLVTVSYVLPVAVVACSGIPAATFTTGSWVGAARILGTQVFGAHIGEWLALAVVAGGALTGVAMFNALTLSYARVPAAMAEDGLLPRVLARRMTNGVPWVAVLACGIGWALALTLQLTRLLELDIMLYGVALVLEFIALVVLRWREPELARPFRVPGGLPMAIGLGVAPTLLVFFTIWAARGDHLTAHVPAIVFGAAILLAGVAVYPLTLMGWRKA
jgi:amino acid transporter